ncbi:hypothetical protein [Bacillus altitudinis]|uniref:hypothetical protein n=1 Tax=Bacillus altitudinis TaxID=293387 RepID=UPI0022807DEC|nr:hypothetical protein [Bacillus altitudinis]MCY7439431.1 hypothetical protein [Bacillus altitudinis]
MVRFFERRAGECAYVNGHLPSDQLDASTKRPPALTGSLVLIALKITRKQRFSPTTLTNTLVGYQNV